tara:strand:+ start:376 stop:534 length:159 start_codon:yes stop_codon:yes gene_type:complete
MTTKEKKEIEKILTELKTDIIYSLDIDFNVRDEKGVLKQIAALKTIINTLNQ